METFDLMISNLASGKSNNVQNMLSLQKNQNQAALDKVDATAKDFEAVFISEMLGPMFSTIQTDPLFGGGEGEDMYKSMMVQEYGKNLANAGGIGLASSLREQFISMQENQ